MNFYVDFEALQFSGRSIKNPSDVKKVEKQLSNAIISGSLFMNCKWEKREVEFIG